MPLNYIDLAAVCLLVYGLVRGAYRGFFVEVSSLLALVLGVFGALHFSNFTASLLANYIEWDYLPLLAFALTFIGIIIGCLLYTSPSPRDPKSSRMPSSA